jgi:hypothetical protein
MPSIPVNIQLSAQSYAPLTTAGVTMGGVALPVPLQTTRRVGNSPLLQPMTGTLPAMQSLTSAPMPLVPTNVGKAAPAMMMNNNTMATAVSVPSTMSSLSFDADGKSMAPMSYPVQQPPVGYMSQQPVHHIPAVTHAMPPSFDHMHMNAPVGDPNIHHHHHDLDNGTSGMMDPNGAAAAAAFWSPQAPGHQMGGPMVHHAHPSQHVPMNGARPLPQQQPVGVMGHHGHAHMGGIMHHAHPSSLYVAQQMSHVSHVQHGAPILPLPPLPPQQPTSSMLPKLPTLQSISSLHPSLPPR